MGGAQLGSWRPVGKCLHVKPGAGDFPPRCVLKRGHEGAHVVTTSSVVDGANWVRRDEWPNDGEVA